MKTHEVGIDQVMHEYVQQIGLAAERRVMSRTPVRLLDLATGPNGTNVSIVRELAARGIDYRLLLTDISPKWFKLGYEHLAKNCSPDELERVSCVLADNTNFRREIESVRIWSDFPERKSELRPLADILNDEHWAFLRAGYDCSESKIARRERFEDGSFDLVTGVIPFGSINAWSPRPAINEAARVLAPGGYLVVRELQVEALNWPERRTFQATLRALGKPLRRYERLLDASLEPVEKYTATYVFPGDERIPEQMVQPGDTVRMTLFVYQKPCRS